MLELPTMLRGQGTERAQYGIKELCLKSHNTHILHTAFFVCLFYLNLMPG